MLELEAIDGAFRLKRIASRPHAGPVYQLAPKGQVVVAETMGGAGMVILDERHPDAERARLDRRALMRRSHPGAGQIDALIAAGQKIALRTRHGVIVDWTRSQKLGLGAALGLAFLLFDHLHATGRITADGLRASLTSIEELLEVEPARKRVRQAA
ncbi:hypothetical protein [Lacibacterium aquatile]